LIEGDRIIVGSLGEGIYVLNASQAFNQPPRVYLDKIVTKEKICQHSI